jgi:hypothetical protein
MKQESGLTKKDGYDLKVPVVEVVQKLKGWLVTIDGENDLFFYSKTSAKKYVENLMLQYYNQETI